MLDCIKAKTAPRNDVLELGDTPALPPLESIRHNHLINKGKHFSKMTVDLWVNLSLEGEGFAPCCLNAHHIDLPRYEIPYTDGTA